MSGSPLAAANGSRLDQKSNYRGQQTTKREELLPFLTEDHYTDTVLVVEGKKLYIHRCILGYASLQLQNLVENAHKLTATDKRSKPEVKINNKSYSDIVELLAYLHPGTCNDVTEKSALRLLPLANDFGITHLKEKCEQILIGCIRKSPSIPTKPKASPIYKRKDNFNDMLLKCIKSADAGASKSLMDECVKCYANPDISLKEFKASTEVSDQLKARVFEMRMEQSSSKMSKLVNELEKERSEKESLQKQLDDRSIMNNPRNRVNQTTRFSTDSSTGKHGSQISSQPPPKNHHHHQFRQGIDSFSNNGRGKFAHYNGK